MLFWEGTGCGVIDDARGCCRNRTQPLRHLHHRRQEMAFVIAAGAGGAPALPPLCPCRAVGRYIPHTHERDCFRRGPRLLVPRLWSVLSSSRGSACPSSKLLCGVAVQAQSRSGGNALLFLLVRSNEYREAAESDSDPTLPMEMRGGGRRAGSDKQKFSMKPTACYTTARDHS
jgi:hypothetical protein